MSVRGQQIAPWLMAAVSCVLAGVPFAVAVAEALDDAQAVEAIAAPVSERLHLAPGAVRSVEVSQLKRVAIGDPSVVDVTVVSPQQLLVQAKKRGVTNLIIWDVAGERQLAIRVEARDPKEIELELRQLIARLGLPSVQVEQREGQVFVVGTVPSDTQMSALEQLVTSFGDVVVNLVQVEAPVEEVVEADTVTLVKLSVQVVELSQTALEKLGVKWSESVALAESAMPVSSVRDQLLRVGEHVQRSTFLATLDALVQQNKARVLSEPKLVTASGKEASSFIGVEVPIPTATAASSDTNAVTVTVTHRKTGVLLKMTPTVHSENGTQKITTVLEAELSGIDTSVGLTLPVGAQTVLVPGFKVRKANTEVTTLSGETVLVAGLLESEDSNTMSQVPGLGSMPFVGRLFRSPEIESLKRELVIAVTPEILEDPAAQNDRRQLLDQALSSAEVAASVDDARLRYALQIQERIGHVLRYPQRERELSIEGTVKLKLHLFSDGTLGRAFVAESSGSEALDTEALRASEAQAPYPPFPTQLAQRELWMEVPVVFRP